MISDDPSHLNATQQEEELRLRCVELAQGDLGLAEKIYSFCKAMVTEEDAKSIFKG